jgi:hypothetical protein
MSGNVESLNASVAGALALFEVRRRRPSPPPPWLTYPFPTRWRGATGSAAVL